MKKMKTVSYGSYDTRKLFQKKPQLCYKNVNSYVNRKIGRFQSKARFQTVPFGSTAGAKAR